MVNRNQGSGTRILIDRLLAGAQPPGYAVQPRSHNAVAAAVAQGPGRLGRGHPRCGRAAGLGFLPLDDEQYDFVVPRPAATAPPCRLPPTAGQPEAPGSPCRDGIGRRQLTDLPP